MKKILKIVKKIFLILLNLPYSILCFFGALFSLPRKIEIRGPGLIIYARDFSLIKIYNFLVHAELRKVMKNKSPKGYALGHVVVIRDDISEDQIEKIIQHELVHVEQGERYPLIFPILSIIETFRHGYANNRFEMEAYDRSDTWTPELLKLRK